MDARSLTGDSEPDKKRCTKCGEDKPLTEYSLLRRGGDKLRAMCNACKVAYARHWSRADRKSSARYLAAIKEKRRAQAIAEHAARLAAITEKLCRTCGQTKPTSDFYPKKGGGFRPACKTCSTAGARRWLAENAERCAANIAAWRERNRDHCKAYREANRERHLEASRRYKREHPDKTLDACHRHKARLKNAPAVEKVSRLEIAERDGWICHICGKPVTKKNWSLDHLTPLSKGGEHTAKNIALAHRICNSRRGPGRLPAQLRLF